MCVVVAVHKHIACYFIENLFFMIRLKNFLFFDHGNNSLSLQLYCDRLNASDLIPEMNPRKFYDVELSF